jgi:hypothetical protein
MRGQRMKFLDALWEKLQDGISSEIMIAGIKALQNFQRRHDFKLAEDSF